MNFTQSFRLAIKSLLTSKMRALLTMLGIIIGVAAVIVIISLGNGMQDMLDSQFEKLGSNLIQVQIMGRGGDASSRSISPDDMYALVDKYPQYLSGVSPYVNAQAAVRCGTEDYDQTSVYGCSENFVNVGTATVASGRFLQYIDVERLQNVCVIGSYLNQAAFKGDGLGKTIQITGSPYTVIGILEENGDSTEGSDDDCLYIPYTNAARLNGTSHVNFYLFSATDRNAAATAKGIIENRLLKTFQDSDVYMVVTAAEMMDAMNTMMNTMMTVLVAIAAISLLVGGIGIMNIMLVSVTERTREIGIRKSLGAKRRDIRGQFIIEAGTTSAIGGMLGIGLGVLLAIAAGGVIGNMMGEGFSAHPTITAVGVAFGVSVGIGILFGYLPANKASKLNPIDALRYD
ncbi:MAG: ABC transporter permease [Intestinimonas sp.]|jgi:putative ABC transport system permease protein|nr:ABC transporter permease [Intestinimonas sp.]